MNERAFIVTAAIASVLVVAVTPGAPWDFTYDWLIAKTLTDGGDPLRPLNELAADQGLHTDLRFIHPRTPGALLLQAPLALIPWGWVVTAGQLLVAAACLWLMWLVGRIVGVTWPVLAAPLLLVLPPVDGAMWTGNTAILVAALIAWTWHSGTGWGVGMATTLKVWPWLIIPALFIAGRRRAAVQAAGVVGGLNVIGLWLPNVSVAGTFAAAADARQHAERSLGFGLSLGWSVAIGLVFLLLVWQFRWDPVWAVPAGLAIAPILWTPYLAALAVPAAVLNLRFRRFTGTSRTRTFHQGPS